MVRKLNNHKKSSNGAPGMNKNFFEQAKMMQDEIEKVQENLKLQELEASVGGGSIVTKINGNSEILDIKISKDLLKDAAENDDVEMLEDLIMSSIKEATRMAEELSQKTMESENSGMDMSGLSGLL